MTAVIDLEAYFQRIGYTGERRATLDVLRSIQFRHTQTIAFENLNPLMGWPVLLDVGSLQQKMVRDGRGGYCFEQNLLLKHALETLGFHITGLAARVLWNTPEEVIPPRSHMLLLVDLDDHHYVVDAGFGGVTLTSPLLLTTDIHQATPHELFRLLKMNDEYITQVNIRDEWITLYRFSLSEHLLPDYEVASWYLSTHPDSLFVNRLLAARVASECRYALRNNQMTLYHRNGDMEHHLITNVNDMRQTLKNEFHITLPDVPELEALLMRVTTQTE
ncbi:MAG: N-hydroxyarylamine O-acetyltransferase [Nitrospirales bacterium]|nr:MAG: N-hydroxyarylamine O-acetyltransferase [Nitrospirales bacterium]